MPFKCAKCRNVVANGQVGNCPYCGNKEIIFTEETAYLQAWESKNSLNPYAVTLSSGSATLSSSVVINNYPETWKSFKTWSEENKISDITVGTQDERVALLYSGKTEGLMEEAATYIATKLKFTVVTAPYIYEQGSGKKIAIQPRPKESLNQYIKRFISEARSAIVLYTEQSGQIIETSFCSEMDKHTLGLVNFYRGRREPNGSETPCPFFKNRGNVSQCICRLEDSYGDKVCGHICSSPVFCPFTQQEITKMVFDFYITSPNMYLFGSTNMEDLKEPIEPFLNGKIKK